MRVRLESVAFDAGTQIRAAIDSQVVSDYAEAMTNGATFPPIVLFHDGTQHYLADGFHRFLAAQRNQCTDIEADVQPGTKQDAIWFALGANKANGKRLTEADKRHAIDIALVAWPERSARDIAEQIGCSFSYVSKVRNAVLQVTQTPHVEVPQVLGRDGKRYPAARRTEAETARRTQITQLIQAGKSSDEINKAIGKVRHDLIAEVRRELGLGRANKSREAVAGRRERMRAMAAEGYTSRQIANTLGVSENGCRETLRAEGIDVPADKVTRGTHRHDSNRIVDRIVMDATNLTEGVNLIDFAALDHERIGEWADALTVARKALDGFIKRLVKEQQKHGEAA